MDRVAEYLNELWYLLAQQSAAIQAIAGLLAIASGIWAITKFLKRRPQKDVGRPTTAVNAGGDFVGRDKITAEGDIVYGNKVTIPPRDSVSALAGANLRLIVSYNTLDRQPDKHTYQLVASVRNDGPAVARSYGFDLWFPTDSLVPRPLHGHTPFVERTPEGAFTRISFRNDKSVLKDQSILVGDTQPILPRREVFGGDVKYTMTDQIRQKYKYCALKYRLDSDSVAPIEGGIPFNQWQNY